MNLNLKPEIKREWESQYFIDRLCLPIILTLRFFLCLFSVFHLTFCVDFENQLRLTAVVSGLVVCVPTTLFCESVVASRVTFAIQSVALNVASDVN